MKVEVLQKLEFNKIMQTVATFAILDASRVALLQTLPSTDLQTANTLLHFTTECQQALFEFGLAKLEYFPPLEDCLKKVQKGATLNLEELLDIYKLLKSSSTMHGGILSLPEKLPQLIEIANVLYVDKKLQKSIDDKILSTTALKDTASEKLYQIRLAIRQCNEKIRHRLQEYLQQNSQYLQEAIITIRDNRYVLPVRAEHKNKIKGFVHDRSATGSTFFIEPTEVLELNNQLREYELAEKAEEEHILHMLSIEVAEVAEFLIENCKHLVNLDCGFAKAYYSYKHSCNRPKLNNRGIVAIHKGRHPLLVAETIVPVSLSFGQSSRILLLSGPNTGGKTVTLKMCGLFCLMAASGLFIPAMPESQINIFDEIFCDIGDAQSIEENLSTFSSHIQNIIHITEEATANSLVLIDELGSGTDPDEGQAIAKAVLEFLLHKNTKGIVTTHYSSLKEFAYIESAIENASMQFDSNTLQPLYKVVKGHSGNSNAIAISRKLGLREEILKSAIANLSQTGQVLEEIVKNAEQSRIDAENVKNEAIRLQKEWEKKLLDIEKREEELKKQEEKLLNRAKVESRRIVNERLAEAEALLEELQAIFDQAELTQADLIHARSVKNKLANKAYVTESEDRQNSFVPVENIALIKLGDTLYYNALNCQGVVQSINMRRQEVQLLCGNMRVQAKLQDVAFLPQIKKPEKPKKKTVQVMKNTNTAQTMHSLEINILGCTVDEGVLEVDAFIDRSILAGYDSIKIIHGIGTGRLKEGIHQYLKRHKQVKEFRQGIYGEGEAGVTIVTLK